jgi:hypothetical protein
VQRPLGRVVGDADPALVEEAGEHRPALEQVVDCPRHLGVARELGALARIQVSRLTTSGVVVAWRSARRSSAAAPLIVRSWSKIASIR